MCVYMHVSLGDTHVDDRVCKDNGSVSRERKERKKKNHSNPHATTSIICFNRNRLKRITASTHF